MRELATVVRDGVWAAGVTIRRRVRAGAVLVGLPGTTGCHRVTYGPRPEPIDGVRFGAIAEVEDAGAGAVRVRVWARNGAGRERRLDAGGGCSSGLVAWLAPVGRGSPPGRARASRAAWSSADWHGAELAALRARDPRDSTADGRPVVYGVCAQFARQRILAPGDSGEVAAEAFPVRAVLGDSLPPGRYRVTARLTGNGWAAGVLDAGEVVLQGPG